MPSSKPLRVLVVIVGAVLLLAPGFLMAFAWGGTLNLEVAALAVAVSIVVAIWLPRAKWLVAAVAALLIAVPPFPYWTDWDESRGQYLHFFHGFDVDGALVTRFVIVFAFAMLLFSAIFWAMRSPSVPKEAP